MVGRDGTGGGGSGERGRRDGRRSKNTDFGIRLRGVFTVLSPEPLRPTRPVFTSSHGLPVGPLPRTPCPVCVGLKAHTDGVEAGV